jgi:D-alanine-D-alanine ligase-like ATP-grasp enzyme
MTTIILFGGRRDERHVSVASAQNIVRTLGAPLAWFWAPNGSVCDVHPDDLLAHPRPFTNDFHPSRPAIWPDLEMALDTLPVDDPVFLLALHGGEGEDGTVQRMMEARGIPFTGSGPESSAAAFDKGRAKEIVKERVRVAESLVVEKVGDIDRAAAEMLARYQKIVLKPLAGGSSRGLFFLERGGEIPAVENVPFIELNTLPGLTSASLLPQELREAGIGFREFLEQQIVIARKKRFTRRRGGAEKNQIDSASPRLRVKPFP